MELMLRCLNAEGRGGWPHSHASAHLGVLVDIAVPLLRWTVLQLLFGQVVLKLVGLVDVKGQILLQLRDFALQILTLLVVILSLRLVNRI